jgi:glutamate-1-semialdehyde aminotransferase
VSKNLSVDQKLDLMDKGIKEAFSRIKDELSEHLDTINQNTQELTSAYQYIAELEGKVEKLSERLDEVTVATNKSAVIEQMEFKLSVREQEVFACLYAHPQGVTANQAARLLGLTGELVTSTLFYLLEKGVAIHKQQTESGISYQLDRNFRDLQSRKQLIEVHPSIIEQFSVLTQKF